ncbi:hypothetical protein SI65_04929 [Aspergillus cristatus]|uniref:Rhodopsin domain-containing protein n=1 Tax=Aspergillus cristatus TaxID=573508 RepID=A0A1E3BG51_ASPCR|nr:hypothetical protein SI65_04929 [Aspergillus cristatus]
MADSHPYMTQRGAQGMAVSIIFTGLATSFVLARLYTRIWIMKRMEANDWMILVALVNSFVFMALFILESLNGMGMHIAHIPPPILTAQMKAFWATIPFYNAAVLTAKATIIMQYHRVFPTRRMRHISWIMIALLATYGTWCVLSAFLNCIPVAKFWDPSIEGYCLSQKGLWFSNAAIHIATDLAILVIPVPALVALELPRRQKVALIAIFALGGFVCVTSSCRLVALKTIADSSDPTYDNAAAASWSAVECNVGIICACLPTLRPLISRMMPRLLSTLSGTDTARISRGQALTHDAEYGDAAAEAEKVLAMVRGNMPDNGNGADLEKYISVQDHKEALVKTEATMGSLSSSSSSPRK